MYAPRMPERPYDDTDAWPTGSLAPVDGRRKLPPRPTRRRKRAPRDEEALVVAGVAITSAMTLLTFAVAITLVMVMWVALGARSQPEHTLQDVLRPGARGPASLAAVLEPTGAAPAPSVASPARGRRTATPPRRSKDDRVEMSLAELRTYLGEVARGGQAAAAPAARVPIAAPPPPPMAARRPTPAPSVADVLGPRPMAAPPATVSPAAPAPLPALAPPPPVGSAPVGSAAAPVAAASERAPVRTAARRQVIMVDGYPPMDPVQVDLDIDVSDAIVYIDGQEVGVGSLAMIVEAGSHEVRIETPKSSGVFQVTAGIGDVWCFSARGRAVRATSCRRR